MLLNIPVIRILTLQKSLPIQISRKITFVGFLLWFLRCIWFLVTFGNAHSLKHILLLLEPQILM